MIRKIEEIKTVVTNFTIHRLEWISDFHLHGIHNKYFELVSTLDITFLLNENETTYELCIRFSDIEALRFESGGMLTQISGFNINSLKENGYHPLKYEIEDYENGIIHFYCSDIEFLSLVESEYLVI